MNKNSRMYGSCEARSSAAVPAKQIRPWWSTMNLALLTSPSGMSRIRSNPLSRTASCAAT